MKNHPGKKAVSRRILKQNIPELVMGWVQSEEHKRTSTLTKSGRGPQRGRSQGTYVWSMENGFCPFFKTIASFLMSLTPSALHVQ